jgi:hypothetical protein
VGLLCVKLFSWGLAGRDNRPANTTALEVTNFLIISISSCFKRQVLQPLYGGMRPQDPRVLLRRNYMIKKTLLADLVNVTELSIPDKPERKWGMGYRLLARATQSRTTKFV